MHPEFLVNQFPLYLHLLHFKLTLVYTVVNCCCLTHRDVQSLAGVQVSYVHFSPMCRCPPSHPRVDPADSTRCVQYPSNSGLVARGTARRVRDSAHPLGHINDGNLNSAWVSEVGNSTAVLTVDMGAVPYEVSSTKLCSYIHTYIE